MVTALGKTGREVRCGHCSHHWFVVPQLEVDTDQPADDTQAPFSAQKANRMAVGADLRRATQTVMAWLGLVLVILAAVGIVFGRNDIAAAIPETAAIYQRVGLPLILRSDLEFRSLMSEQVADQNETALVIRGNIQNFADAGSRIPSLELDLLDENLEVVGSRMFDLDQSDLDGGASMSFEIRYRDPPSSARTFRLSFRSAAG